MAPRTGVAHCGAETVPSNEVSTGSPVPPPVGMFTPTTPGTPIVRPATLPRWGSAIARTSREIFSVVGVMVLVHCRSTDAGGEDRGEEGGDGRPGAVGVFCLSCKL